MGGNPRHLPRLGAAALCLGIVMITAAGVAGADETVPTDQTAVTATTTTVGDAPDTVTTVGETAPDTATTVGVVATDTTEPPAPKREAPAISGDVSVLDTPTTVLTTGAATLKSDHRGSENPGFGTGSCPANTTDYAGTWGWHFVLQGSTTGFVTITATFDAAPHDDVNTTTFVDSDSSDNLTITGYAVGSGSNPEAFVASPNDQHAYVFTPDAGYMLLSASATTQGSGTLDTEFNLSHVCTGTVVTTTTEASTSTTLAPTTTTLLVLGTEVTAPSASTEAPGVMGEQALRSSRLAFTGSGPFTAALFAGGVLFVIVGGVLLATARRNEQLGRR